MPSGAPLPSPVTVAKTPASPRSPSGRTVEDADVAALGIVHIEPAFVAREAEAVRLGEVVDEERQLGAVFGQAIDAAEVEFRRARHAEDRHAADRSDR